MTQWGGWQTFTHLGQSINSHALSGHMGLQSGLSHLTSQIAAFGSKHDEWHFGGSHTGVQTASHLGSSHFHEHSGWHFYDKVIEMYIKNKSCFILIITNKY